MARLWEVPFAATPLLVVGWVSIEWQTWWLGVLFGALLALYAVAVGQWLTGWNAGRSRHVDSRS